MGDLISDHERDKDEFGIRALKVAACLAMRE